MEFPFVLRKTVLNPDAFLVVDCSKGIVGVATLLFVPIPTLRISISNTLAKTPPTPPVRVASIVVNIKGNTGKAKAVVATRNVPVALAADVAKMQVGRLSALFLIKRQMASVANPGPR